MLSKIKDAFKANGISYWFDEDGIYSGDEFASVLTRAIRNSEIFLFVSSIHSNQSKWTSNEISTALEFGKPIIPFRIDDSPYNDSVMMKIISYDYIECKDEEKAINKLIRAVKHHLPESPYFVRNRWRNIDVPEGARGTVVGFIVGDEVQRHTFSCEDYEDKVSIYDSIAEKTIREVLADRDLKKDAFSNETDMQQERIINMTNEKERNRIISINARNKGCALSVMVALGLLILIGFFPFSKYSYIMTEGNQQIAQVDNSRKEICISRESSEGGSAPQPVSPPESPPQTAHSPSQKPSLPKKKGSNSPRKTDNCHVDEMSGENNHEDRLIAQVSIDEKRNKERQKHEEMSRRKEELRRKRGKTSACPEVHERLAKEHEYLAINCGERAYNAILKGNFLDAESLSLRGLKADSTQHWIATNLAAALLFQGKAKEAEKIFCQYKDELKMRILDNFNAFEKAGVIPEERKNDVEHIRQMLEE